MIKEEQNDTKKENDFVKGKNLLEKSFFSDKVEWKQKDLANQVFFVSHKKSPKVSVWLKVPKSYTLNLKKVLKCDRGKNKNRKSNWSSRLAGRKIKGFVDFELKP